MFLEGRELQDEREESLTIGTNLNSTVVSDKLLIWKNAERVQADHIHLDFGLSSISTAQKWWIRTGSWLSGMSLLLRKVSGRKPKFICTVV